MYAMIPVYYPSVEVHPCIVNDIFRELMKIEEQKNIVEENELNMELDEDIGQEM
ncbi:MAG: hypothetical protein WHF31_06195 [Candidatus Dehalobacter alkaniphilus]|uniref:hypothetical protein n=1 Tax=Dehalobacter sp. DCM TaxID=2907827 RepID=UPI0030820FE0|nr:hypothetical protein LPY66_01525 [Dehalobacter sp. DCM]